jgi:signal transduction histidine kinase
MHNNLMYEKVRLKAPLFIPLIIIFTIAAALSIYTLYKLQQSQITDETLRLTTEYHKFKNFFVSKEIEYYQNIIDTLMQDKTIITHFKNNNQEALLSYSKQLHHKYIQSHNISHFYFIKPDKKVFLRVHRPSDFGDTINRFTLNQAEQSLSMQSGIEIGTFKNFTLRVVAPWIIENKLIGYIELGEDSHDISQKITELLNIDYMITINDSHLDKELYIQQLLQNNQPNFWGDFNHFKIVHASNPILPRTHKDLLHKIENDPSQNFFEINQNNKNYHASTFFIYDVSGTEVGKTILLRDTTKVTKELYNFIYYTVMVTLTLMLVLIIIYLFIVSRVETIIDTSRDKLAYLNNHLKEEVNRKTAVLQELTQNLEIRVEEEVKSNLDKESLIAKNAHFIQIGETVSLIAHHWRQPLSSISLIIQDVEDAYQHNELDQKYLHQNISKATSIIEDLSLTIDHFKNFYQTDDTINEISLESLINSSANIIQSVTKIYQINLILEIDNALFITTYINELKQVLVKLITNSFEVLIERKTTLPHIIINAHADKNENIIIEVSDNGGGIDMTMLDELFNPYTSTKEKKNSTGIGLFMAKSTIENKCQGNITVANGSDGACFTLTLPKTIST